jgi:hypothetical protein
MREINDKLKKWDEQMLRDQVQSRSFQFRYAKGLYLWHDIRVWLLDFYHDYQRCLVVPERELEHQRDERRSLASRYHLAIRQSYNNIDDQVRAIITTQHTEIAKENNGEKRARKEDVLEEYEHQRQQLIAILPADWERANPAFNNDLDAIPQEGQLYCDLTPDQREAFWNATWNENVFVSWLWTYQSVLDFQYVTFKQLPLYISLICYPGNAGMTWPCVTCFTSAICNFVRTSSYTFGQTRSLENISRFYHQTSMSASLPTSSHSLLSATRSHQPWRNMTASAGTDSCGRLTIRRRGTALGSKGRKRRISFSNTSLLDLWSGSDLPWECSRTIDIMLAQAACPLDCPPTIPSQSQETTLSGGISLCTLILSLQDVKFMPGLFA